MLAIKEMDGNVPLLSQFCQTSKPVTLVIQFNVPAKDEQQFLEAWKNHGLCMKHFAGDLGEQLHKGIGGSDVYINDYESNSHSRIRQARYADFNQTMLNRS